MFDSQILSGSIGYTVALLSAVAWAYTSILFRKLGDDVSALGLTVGKSIIGISIMAVVLFAFPSTRGGVLNFQDFIYLGLSGLLGISLGDTLFFVSLVLIGPRLVILIGVLGPVFTVFMEYLLKGTTYPSLTYIGIIFTIVGVLWVLLTEDHGSDDGDASAKKKWKLGILCALLATIFNALGYLLQDYGVKNVSGLQGLFVRMIWAGLGLAIYGLVKGELRSWLRPFVDRTLQARLTFASIIAIFGGFYLAIIAIKYIGPSLAYALGFTTPIFILPLAAVLLKEKITLNAFIGASISTAGVIFIFMS